MSLAKLLLFTDDTDPVFKVRRSRGFNDTVDRFGDTPCLLHIEYKKPDVRGVLTHTRHVARLVDMLGIRETCHLESKIMSIPGHLRDKRYAVNRMPSFDNVNRSSITGFMSIMIMQTPDSPELEVRNKTYGFFKNQCAGLEKCSIFASVRDVMRAWGFDVKDTIFE